MANNDEIEDGLNTTIEESDDEDDVDFVPDEKELEEAEINEPIIPDEEEEVVEEPKVDPEEEKRLKEKLWEDFMQGVREDDDDSSRRSSTNSSTTGETAVQVYDFAGERVEIRGRVQERDITPSDHPTPSTSSSTGSSTFTFNKFDASKPPRNYIINLNGLSNKSKGIYKPPNHGKGISNVLSSNPASIGLSGKNGGLKAVLNAIRDRKKKMGTLEKSKLDWQAFKKTEGIEEELQNHVRSKDGYLERQEFLHRTDLRQFEHEKSLRSVERSKRLNNS